MPNQLIILLFFSFAFLIISLILMLKAFIEQIKEGTNESLIAILLTGVVIIFLLPLIIGIIQEIT